MVEALEARVMLASVVRGFVDTTVATGIDSPSSMASAPDGRLFVAEQTGALRVVKNDALLATPFVTLKVDARGERGLLGVAVDPNFASNHFVYVYHTVRADGSTPAHNRVSRFTASGDVAAAGSQVVLLDLNGLSSATNHNGGALAFGPDGKLYVGVGENANGSNAQTTSNLLGKILRINSDGSIPADNPFYNSTTGVNKAIWAIGLRNPFSFAFDHAPRKGRFYVNDVGQATWEEIDEGVVASNYGWPTTEGPTHRKRFRAPVFYYGHGSGPTTGDAIVGAAFYTPATRTFPKNYRGDYFFADLTSGWIRRLDPVTGETASFATGVDVPVALAVGADGALYYLSRGDGRLARVQYGPGGVKRAVAEGVAAPAVFARALIAPPRVRLDDLLRGDNTT